MIRWITLAVLVIALATAAAPARADSARTIDLPVVIERGPLVVRAQRSLEREAHRIADRAPVTLARIAADLPGLPVPSRIDIRLVVWATDIAAASPPGARPPAWAAGVAYPEAGVVVVAERSGPTVNDLYHVADHELAHLALGAALGGQAPRWLNEGFAFLHSSEWSLARTETLIGLAWRGDVIPWSEIDRRFPAREDAAGRAYAQSYDFVAFLARRGRYADTMDDGYRWPFRDFLAAVSRGDDVDTAARKAYGRGLSQLGIEWYDDLRQRYLTLPVSLIGGAVWVLAALLLIAAWFRRRRQRRVKLARWAVEEAAATSVRDGVLTDHSPLAGDTNTKSLPGQNL